MGEESIRRNLLKSIVQVEDAYSLRQFNPLGAGGVADYFTVAHNTVELAAAVKSAIDLKIPYVVIGEGQGVLFSDGGFPGLVVHNQTTSFGVALDKSQVVVDSGMSLPRFITLAASRGLGGLTPFYAEGGTVGGAVYANPVRGGHPFLSLVRNVTMVVPPARLDKEATIVRYKREWLLKGERQTRLQQMREGRSIEEPQPVILTVLFQLTSVRLDELRLRLQKEAQLLRRRLPSGRVLGPIFEAEEGVPLDDLLSGASVAALRVGNVYPDRRQPNYLVGRGGSVRAADIRELIGQMQARVESQYAVSLRCRYEYLGVW